MESKITKRAIEGLTVSQSDVLLWDTEIRGFGARRRPSGAIYYIVKMRDAGRRRWITIGRHGSPWTPNTARTEALRLLAARAAGHDPAIERDRQKAGLTVADLGERFLEEYVAKHCNTRRVVSALYPRSRHVRCNGSWALRQKRTLRCEIQTRISLRTENTYMYRNAPGLDISSACRC